MPHTLTKFRALQKYRIALSPNCRNVILRRIERSELSRMNPNASLPPYLERFAMELVRQQLSGRASNNLIDVAIDAVAAGAESPSLYRLADLDRTTDSEESRRLFEAAARELQLPAMSDGIGIHEVAIFTLELIVSEELSPLVGANLLRAAVRQLLHVDDIRHFETITHLAGLSHDLLERRVDYNARILQEAKCVLAERDFVRRALSVWDGPAAAPLSFIQSFGFADSDEFHRWLRSAREALRDRKSLSSTEWQRSVELAKVAVLDDVNGAGWEWPIVAPYTVAESEILLAALTARMSSNR